MTTQDAIQNHRQVCDELYELALEENHFLQDRRRPPDAALLRRKQTALDRLDQTLAALRDASSDGERTAARCDALEKTQSRIMQILQVNRENEQLLVRHSLSHGAAAQSAAPAPSGVVQRAYAVHA